MAAKYFLAVVFCAGAAVTAQEIIIAETAHVLHNSESDFSFRLPSKKKPNYYLSFDARIDFPAEWAGYASGLEISLNDRKLEEAALINKKNDFTLKRGLPYKWYQKEKWTIAYSSDFHDLDAKTDHPNHPGENVSVFGFEFNITDLVTSGENTINFKNTVAIPGKEYKVVLKNISIRTETDTKAASPVKGAIEKKSEPKKPEADKGPTGKKADAKKNRSGRKSVNTVSENSSLKKLLDEATLLMYMDKNKEINIYAPSIEDETEIKNHSDAYPFVIAESPDVDAFSSAAVIGGPKFGSRTALSFPHTNLYSAKGGAISFWLKEENNPEANKANHHYFTIRGQGRFIAGIYRISTAKILFGMFKESSAPTIVKPVSDFVFDKWIHIVFTWDSSKVVMFFDGKPAAEGPVPPELKVEFPARTYLSVGPTPNERGTEMRPWGADTAEVAGFAVFNRMITAPEALILAGKQAEATSAPGTGKVISIPKVSPPPGIDGKINPGEWDYSMQVPALIDAKDPEGSFGYFPDSVNFCYDDTHLYISFKSHFAPGVSIIKGQQRSADKEPEVWTDESFEFYLAIPSASGQNFYRFAGNPAGGCTEGLNNSSSFNGKWNYKTFFGMKIDNSTYWHGEISIPWATLNISKPDNQTIKANFCRTYRARNALGIASLAGAGSYHSIKDYPDMLLSPDGPGFSITEQTSPENGIFVQKAKLVIPKSASPLTYKITLSSASGLNSKTIFIRAFSSAGPHEITVPPESTAGLFNTLAFSIADEKNSFLSYTVPYSVKADYLQVKTLPGYRKLIITPRINVFRAAADAHDSILIEVEDNNKKIMLKQTVTTEEPLTVSCSPDKGGIYIVRIHAVKGGKNIRTEEKKVILPDPPSWSAVADKKEFSVLPPFQPLTYRHAGNNTAVSMWNKTYTWKNQLFPSGMKTGNNEILAAPVQLLVDEKAVAVSSVDRSIQSEGRYEFTAKGANDAGNVTVFNRLEYDGVLWHTVSLNLISDIKNAEILITLPGKTAKYYHLAKGGFGMGGAHTGRIEGDKSFDFNPVVWLGNEEYGLCFFAETQATWRTAQREPVSIRRVGQNTELRIRIADALKSGSALSFSFGLQATPVRPLPADYPHNTFSWHFTSKVNPPEPQKPYTYSIVLFNDSGAGFWDHENKGGVHLTPYLQKNPNATLRSVLTQEIAEKKSQRTRLIPYMAKILLPDIYTEILPFTDEWEVLPRAHFPYSKKLKLTDAETSGVWLNLCPASGAADYFYVKMKKLIAETGITGVYFDFGCIGLCNNHDHGCTNAYPLLATRAFYRSIARAFVENGITNYIILLHNSEAVQVPCISHVTHLLNGEHFRQMSSDTLHKGKDFLDSVGLESFAVEGSSLPWGVTSSYYGSIDPLLPQFAVEKEEFELYSFRITKSFLAPLLLHNSFPSMMRIHYGISAKVLSVYDRFGVTSAEFLPYWRNQDYVEVNNAEVKVSMYRKAGRAEYLLVVSDLEKNRRNKSVTIKLNPGKTGLAKINSATECMSEKDAAFEALMASAANPVRIPVKMGSIGAAVKGISGTSVTVELEAHSFGLIWVK